MIWVMILAIEPMIWVVMLVIGCLLLPFCSNTYDELSFHESRIEDDD
jgi:hypothetical protein